jgi:hypothetical protein
MAVQVRTPWRLGNLDAGKLMATRSEYLSFRDRYRPETIKLLLVAESPPASGRYFYNPAGARTEPLFAALTG